MLLLTRHTRAVALIVALIALVTKKIIHLEETALEMEMMTGRILQMIRNIFAIHLILAETVCVFSEDKVRANILRNRSILNKNVKIVFEEEPGPFMALY